MLDRLRHAFAVDPPGPAEPTAAQREVAEWLCRQAVDRQLALPAHLCLEMGRPLSFVGSQAMHFTHPLVWAVTPDRTSAKYKHLAEFLERRGAVEWILNRIDELENERKNGPQQAPDQCDPDPK